MVAKIFKLLALIAIFLGTVFVIQSSYDYNYIHKSERAAVSQVLTTLRGQSQFRHDDSTIISILLVPLTEFSLLRNIDRGRTLTTSLRNGLAGVLVRGPIFVSDCIVYNILRFGRLLNIWLLALLMLTVLIVAFKKCWWLGSGFFLLFALFFYFQHSLLLFNPDQTASYFTALAFLSLNIRNESGFKYLIAGVLLALVAPYFLPAFGIYIFFFCFLLREVIRRPSGVLIGILVITTIVFIISAFVSYGNDFGAGISNLLDIILDGRIIYEQAVISRQVWRVIILFAMQMLVLGTWAVKSYYEWRVTHSYFNYQTALFILFLFVCFLSGTISIASSIVSLIFLFFVIGIVFQSKLDGLHFKQSISIGLVVLTLFVSGVKIAKPIYSAADKKVVLPDYTESLKQNRHNYESIPPDEAAYMTWDFGVDVRNFRNDYFTTRISLAHFYKLYTEQSIYFTFRCEYPFIDGIKLAARSREGAKIKLSLLAPSYRDSLQEPGYASLHNLSFSRQILSTDIVVDPEIFGETSDLWWKFDESIKYLPGREIWLELQCLSGAIEIGFFEQNDKGDANLRADRGCGLFSPKSKAYSVFRESGEIELLGWRADTYIGFGYSLLSYGQPYSWYE